VFSFFREAAVTALAQTLVAGLRHRFRLVLTVLAALTLVTGGVATAMAATTDYFQSISIANRSYAFAYDDVNDQSSVRILGNSNPPSLLTIGIGW
jgi:hypothetical protein